MKKNLGIFLATVLCVSLFASGCGSSANSSKSFNTTEFATEAPYEEAVFDSKSVSSDSAAQISKSEAVQNVDTSRKLITTMDISTETENLDQVLSNVERRVTELGGYIEASSIYNGSRYYGSGASRNANLTIRIPADNLNSFVEIVEEQTNITNKSTNVEDVTLSYVDIESRKNALKTEEKRLLEILEKAETVEDVITVESRLSDVRYEIESIESQLRTYDNKINYSTVYLYVDEVKKFTETKEKNAFERMGDGFVESVAEVISFFAEGFIWLVIHIPQILVVVIFILLLILLIKAIDKAGKKKNMKKLQMMQAMQNQNIKDNNGQ